MKLALCHENTKQAIEKSLNFFSDNFDLEDLLSVSLNEVQSLDPAYQCYLFNLNLEDELDTHQKISRERDLVNPFYEEFNIFDDKLLFSKFCLANQLSHPRTWLYDSLDNLDDKDYIVKPRFGTEKKDFADLSIESIEKIQQYDEALVQEKVNFQDEVKVLVAFDRVFCDSKLSSEFSNEIKNFTQLISKSFKLKNLVCPKIYSLDLLVSNGIYFLEINLRPSALYRFKYEFSPVQSQ